MAERSSSTPQPGFGLQQAYLAALPGLPPAPGFAAVSAIAGGAGVVGAGARTSNVASKNFRTARPSSSNLWNVRHLPASRYRSLNADTTAVLGRCAEVRVSIAALHKFNSLDAGTKTSPALSARHKDNH